ncbi:MAG: hypothetical protein N2F24_10565 [Deltaproteobacteria bacterium]
MTEQKSLIHTLQTLNHRRTSIALSMWKGQAPAVEPYDLYADYEAFLTLKTLKRIDRDYSGLTRKRVRHAFIDHYLQQVLMPHETEMQTWMRGAAALVNNERIHFRNIIQWCQQSSTHADREHLQAETGPLCKFMKPFALNHWEILLGLVKEEFGFSTYIDYCRDKKGFDYGWFYTILKTILKETRELYFKAMQAWTKDSFGLPLERLNRFDSINLFGMHPFDGLLPQGAMEQSKTFFEHWGIDLGAIDGLHLDIQRDTRKSDQAMSFLLETPGDVHVVMNAVGGWIDLETLWHELGHGLSAAFTSSHLSVVDRELATSYSLSETYAFLLQNITASVPFLKIYLKISPEKAQQLHYYKTLKDLAAFRRYAAKFIAEYRMFDHGSLEDGEPYAAIMALHTGFYHQPESHLFDLVPEFYCLDYLLGWMGEAIMEAHLRNSFGADWMFQPEAGDLLKQWWRQGNQIDIIEFFKKNDLGALTADLLVKRWCETLSST